MSDRQEFLRKAGWEKAGIAPLPGDASTRHYARLSLDGRTAMLMDQPQGAETAVAPPDADEATRRALGYNAVARLAGADCRRFAAAADFLRARGLGAPAIYAADYPHGLLLLEDLGDTLFTDVIPRGVPEEQLYKAAVEALARLHREKAPETLAPGLPLFAYDEIALIAERLGARDVPRSCQAVEDYLQCMRPQLLCDARSHEVVDILLDAPAPSRMAQPVGKLMLNAGIDLLPDWARDMLDLHQNPLQQRMIRLGINRIAPVLRWAMRNGSAHRARRRMGLE